MTNAHDDAALAEASAAAANMLRGMAEHYRGRAGAGPLAARLRAAILVLEGSEKTAVREDEERFRLLVESVVDYAIFMLDPDGRIATWNGGAERLKGYRADEAIGRNFDIFYLPEERAVGMPRRELEIAASEGRYAEEGWRVRKDGSRFWASVVLTALRDKTGTLRGYAKVTRDVSEIRGTLEAVRQSEERLRLMIGAVRDYAIFMLDPEGRITSWNSGAQRLKGYTLDEVLGRSFEMFYTEADRERAHPQEELRLAIAEGRYEEEGWRVRKDGTQFWANVVITAIFDGDGRHLGFSKVTRDFTERKHADEKLRQSEERFRLIVESVKDYAIFMLDTDGHITTWNRGAEHIKGYRPDEVIGRHFSMFYTPEDVAAGHPDRELRIARAEGRYEEEGWRVRKTGERLWATVVLTAIYDEQNVLRGYAKVTRDLTERRRMEREALVADRAAAEERARTAEAQAAVHARDEFIAVAAHELRTPLAALKLKLQGSLKLLAKKPLDPVALDGRLDSAGRHVDRLTKLTDRLLDVSRIVGGRFEIYPQTMDLRTLIDEIVADFREPALAAGCELTLEGPPSVVGEWDVQRLEQAIVNLLTNAIKYGAGKPIRVRVEEGKGFARVVVQDQGIGINSADVDRIFGRFERAVPVTSYAGLGLGLYISRHIIEAHSGSINVDSSLGIGSTFVIALPQAAHASTAADAHAELSR